VKTFFKVLGILLLTVIALVAIGVSWLAIRKPAQRPASTERIEQTPARLARGEYLVEHVTECLSCHSDHVTDRYGIPVKPGTEGQGGFIFDKKIGFPGVVAAQNITSDKEYGLGAWTDGEILRAMREGIDRNGNALFPMMPYVHLRNLDDEDAKSIIVYIRTLKAVHNQVPMKKIDFPVNLFIKFVPQPVDGPVSAPPRTDSVAYGKYLTTIAGCYECHTPKDSKQNLIADRAFSGGWEMNGPWGRVVTANITPHPDTYLGRATREEFIARFKALQSLNAETSPVAEKGHNTVMPWLAYAGMDEQDLGSIYDYLKTVKPIEHKVNSFPDATPVAAK
jgi:hypothetical protein